jgi:ankyrin repeat protein
MPYSSFDKENKRSTRTTTSSSKSSAALREKSSDSANKQQPINDGGDKDIWMLASKGSTAELKRLIKRGVSPNAQIKRNKKSALHFAVINGEKDAAEALLDGGCDVLIKDDADKTAMNYVEEMLKSKKVDDKKFISKLRQISTMLRTAERKAKVSSQTSSSSGESKSSSPLTSKTSTTATRPSYSKKSGSVASKSRFSAFRSKSKTTSSSSSSSSRTSSRRAGESKSKEI